jgi:NTP pyrophosphatase (non-canonical NTP hydrolase)
MELQVLQDKVDSWIKNYGVRYFDILTNMAQLTEEVGEVARIISRRYGEQSEKKVDLNKDLGEELSDVIFVVLCIANQTGINLQKSFDKKIILKSKRDKERHMKNPKLNKN